MNTNETGSGLRTRRRLVSLGWVLTVLGLAMAGRSLAQVAVAWGLNNYGQAAPPTGLTNAVAIGGGEAHSLALQSDGRVAVWGTWAYGLTNVPPDLTHAVSISAGLRHNVALNEDGVVVAWGLGASGQTNVPEGLSNVVAVAAGAFHGLALLADGMVRAWGSSSSGQADVPANLTDVRAIAGGGYHSLALMVDGRVTAWGQETYGQTAVPPDLTHVVAIAAGLNHNLALKRDGTVVTWGQNNYGQCDVPDGLTNGVGIAAGGYHSLVLRADGTVVAWGQNTADQAEVPADLTNAVAVAGGMRHSLALVGDGRPFITVPPMSRGADIGGSADFLVMAVGSPPLAYQWLRDGARLSGQERPTLSLTNVQVSDTADYAVSAANAYGAVTSRVARLTVHDPTILSHPESQSVIEGGEVTLRVDAAGTEPIGFQWFFQGTNALAGQSSATLLLTNVQLLDGGEYQVVVCNVQGCATSRAAIVEVLPPPEQVQILTATLIPMGAVWRYLDDGSNQRTEWREPDFDDGGWASGPARLGYGDDGEVTIVGFGTNASSKFITTYFRHVFTVPKPDIFHRLTLRVIRDDGAAVYLNGDEVFRSNLPTNALDHTTLASAPVSRPDELIAFYTNLSPALLRPGTNVVAVEIHQIGGDSSDLGLDLELTGEATVLRRPVPLSATHSNNQVTLAWPWPSVGFVLHSSSGTGTTGTWSTVTRPVSARGGEESVAVAVTPTNEFYRLRNRVVDASTLTGKLLMGYQGWFGCPGDGAPPDGWIHWFRRQPPVATNVTVDFWPDITELDPDELFETRMTLPDSQPARVYSAYKQKTVVRHFRWMHDHELDGVFLQRFSSELGSRSFSALRDQVARNVRAGAEAYGRVFAMMYDISGQDEGTLVSRLGSDWAHLTGTLRLTNSPRYLRHQGRPVVAVWGFGFTDRPGTPQQAQEVIDHFKASGCTVMGGVPTNWRTLDGDSKNDPAWAGVYRSFDIISPWAVGRFSTVAGADNFRRNKIAPDLVEAQAHGRDYLPVVWPGFSWHNLNGGALNAIPRNAGLFYWRQVYNAIAAGCTMLYGAMFDEVDEGTAMFKLAPTPAQLPVEGQFVPLNIDGYELPSDWYLRLANEAGKMLRGEILLRPQLPIAP